MNNLFHLFCKRFARIKAVQFLGLLVTWYRTNQWLKQDNLTELKREMIILMQEATYIGLVGINWWIPKHTSQPAAILNEEKLQKVSQAAFIERHQKDNAKQ